MSKVDARHIFQAVNITGGLACAAALTHIAPVSACLSLIALSQAGLAAACVCPRCALVGPVLTRVVTRRAEVALTFDDGPSTQLTPWVLETLAQYDAKASFFCIGTRARRHTQEIQAIAAGGHSIENHSHHHRYRFAFLGSRQMAHEIDDAQGALADLCGQPPRFFRAPFGFRNPALAPLLAARHLRYTAWSHRGFDTSVRNPLRVHQRLTHNLSQGAILLLHDGHGAYDNKGRPVIHTVLPALLRELHERGLKAVSLPTLVAP